jgi:hypothetical protein
MRTAVMVIVLALSMAVAHAQDEIPATGKAPNLYANFSIGFNYDFLHPPTKVSFDYPRGYIGLNIPFRYGLHNLYNEPLPEQVGDFLGDNDTTFTPIAMAQQNANKTIRVDVPMIGGVGTFANIENFYLGYRNILGEPRVEIAPDVDSTVEMFMAGMVGVPLDLSIAWETMVFGYAFQVNDNLTIALNLNRHLFVFDLHARVNVDLLGYFSVDVEPEGADEEQMAEAGVGGIHLENDIDYSSHEVFGSARGHYEAEAWTPTIGIKFWRLGLTSRFGLKTKAPGSLEAKYQLPFFIDPETFEMPDFSDPDYLMNNYQRILNGDVDSIAYSTEEPMEWEMPQGHTLTFDIVPDKLYLSYTKFFGEIRMAISGISAKRKREDLDTAEIREVGFDVGVSVDHIAMLHGSFYNAFFNIGAFALDLRNEDTEDILPNAVPDLRYAGGIVMPVLNFGTAMGSKMQLLLELDLLPLTALKTGLIYHF